MSEREHREDPNDFPCSYTYRAAFAEMHEGVMLPRITDPFEETCERDWQEIERMYREGRQGPQDEVEEARTQTRRLQRKGFRGFEL